MKKIHAHHICVRNKTQKKHKKNFYNLNDFSNKLPKCVCVCVCIKCVFFLWVGFMVVAKKVTFETSATPIKTCKIEDKKGLLHQILPCRYVHPSYHTIHVMVLHLPPNYISQNHTKENLPI